MERGSGQFRERPEAAMAMRVGCRVVTDDPAAAGMTGPEASAPASRVWVFVESADEDCDLELIGGVGAGGLAGGVSATAAPPWAYPLWRECVGLVLHG